MNLNERQFCIALLPTASCPTVVWIERIGAISQARKQGRRPPRDRRPAPRGGDWVTLRGTPAVFGFGGDKVRCPQVGRHPADRRPRGSAPETLSDRTDRAKIQPCPNPVRPVHDYPPHALFTRPRKTARTPAPSARRLTARPQTPPPKPAETVHRVHCVHCVHCVHHGDTSTGSPIVSYKTRVHIVRFVRNSNEKGPRDARPHIQPKL